MDHSHPRNRFVRSEEAFLDAGADALTTREELLDAVLPQYGDTAKKATAFWALLVCSAFIAAAGILLNSTATVIGAMVIAPLGTPLYGIAAALVAGEGAGPALRRVMIAVVVAVLAGIASEALLLETIPTASNEQIIGRTNPSLTDLFVAFFTGLAGCLALIRLDISPALPGVAIAISLVPPLAVAGIVLSDGEVALAAGALTLFATNAVAIIGAGLLVFAVAGIRPSRGTKTTRRAHAALFLAAAILVTLLSLGTYQSWVIVQDEDRAARLAHAWAADHDEWRVEFVETRGTSIYITFIGSGEVPSIGLASVDVDELFIGSDLEVVIEFRQGITVEI